MNIIHYYTILLLFIIRWAFTHDNRNNNDDSVGGARNKKNQRSLESYNKSKDLHVMHRTSLSVIFHLMPVA